MFFLPRIYPITDRHLSGLSHAEQVEQLIAGGAALIQLREKTAEPREFYAAAELAMELSRRHKVPLIINDRADVAMAVGAAGVHLGQDDLPPEAARELLGPGAIIGFSTHNVEQAMRADALPIDYLAVGPIFPTSTKQDPDKVIGLEGLSAVRRIVRKPLVAIGGITRANIRDVLLAGADSVAVISAAVAGGAGIEESMRGLAEASIDASHMR